MTRDNSKLRIYVRPGTVGRPPCRRLQWPRHRRDCAAPGDRRAVLDGLGMRPMRIDVEPLDTGEPLTRSGAQPLTLAHLHRMLTMADGHVGSAGALVRAQQDRLGTLACEGRCAAGPDFCWVTTRDLQTMTAHRQLIAEQIERSRLRRQRSERVDHRRATRCIRLNAADPCLLDSRFIAYKGLTSRTSVAKFRRVVGRRVPRPPCCSRHCPKIERTRGNVAQS
ncbi:hypothetical protein AWB72_05083 [Caballeronia concitans]|uniref:Uncharacterized protein n=1 Tax=Caballeronia concitans TaxID=1777133 RepID=A0A658R4B0_9BURK|nr:hypothetical protein AWB72_05083 [Caballeronia concitans]